MSTTTTREEYQFLKNFLYEKIGYNLGDDKEYLAETRIGPLAAVFELGSWVELVQELQRTRRSAIQDAICDAMTTNETSFFRDKKPFAHLVSDCIPKLIQEKQASRTIKIWSAACSSGQEPYTIALTLKENFPQLAGWNVQILATDISTTVLERARAGDYSQFEAQRGMPIQLLLKYFDQKGDRWIVKDEIRKLIHFRRFNLLDSFNTLGGPFDIIFMRNVLIYFDSGTKAQIFDKVARTLTPEGFFFLGGTETTLGISDRFVRKQPTTPCFQLR